MKQARDAIKQSNASILVADDDPIVQLVVKKMLEQAGYNPDFVSNGAEAISALESRYYDLVLMDCFMPQMDGFEATRLIRNADSGNVNPSIPVIALTGLSEEEDQLRCFQAGMNSFVKKPVDSQTLIAAIEKCLGEVKAGPSVLQHDQFTPEPIMEDDFLDTVIDQFLAEVPLVITRLNQAISQGEKGELQSIAHRLRGAADILQASTLSARSRALEQAGKAGDHTLACRLARALVKELQKLDASLAG